MSFLFDPPALSAAGETYARVLPESAQGRRAGVTGAGVVGGFLAVSVSLWRDLPWVRPMWRLSRARNGTDFMVGSGLASVDAARKPGRALHAFAAIAFLTYPLWYWLGWDRGRRARP